MSTKDNLDRYDSYIERGKIGEALKLSSSKVKGGQSPSNNDVIWMLQSASASRLTRDYRLSIEYFDRAEGLMRYYSEKSDKNLENIWATVTNDTGLAYKGKYYDGVMVNTYKALNFMILGDYDSARIEFNRAVDRQRLAKEFFSTEIAKQTEKLKSQNPAAYQNAASGQNMQILDEKYPQLKLFQSYQNYINPFASYMAGLFFYLEGDYAKAEFLMKQSVGMAVDNRYILEDLALIEAGEPVENTLWIVFENGLGPVKDEFRIDLPLFIATNQVQYVGIALPKLRTRSPAYPYFLVNDGNKNYNTAVLADMERVIGTEFSKEYTEIFIRAVVSATAKATAQYAMYKNEGSIGALLAAVYAFATTRADCRIWSALPNDFQVVRMKKPEGGVVKISAGGMSSHTKELKVPEQGNTIVYVRVLSPEVEPVYETITF